VASLAPASRACTERTAALERSRELTNEEKRAAFQRLSHTPGIRTGQDYADSLLNKDRMQVGDLVEWTMTASPVRSWL